MTRLLLLAGLLVAASLPANASAASPCRNQIYNDWYRDGKIASTYPISCYRDAIKHVHADAAIYSSLSDDIRAALHAALRRSHGLAAPTQVGHGFKALGAGAVKGTLAAVNTPPHDPSSDNIVATAKGAPLPILVLGGIALALVAAGAVGTGVRHFRSRR